MTLSLEDLTSRLSLAEGIKTFPIPNFKLQSGATLPSTAWIAYKTFGSPSLPAVLYPTWFSGLIADNEWLIGNHLTLNPEKYFIIVPALIGNGQSISPSNTNPSNTSSSSSSRTVPEDEYDKVHPFPDVTFYDNVRAQHLLVTQGLGVKRLRAVLGWSMGAAQTFQWATQFPDMLDICVPFCGSARTSLHNQVFLEGVKSALLAGKGLRSGGSKLGRVEGDGVSIKEKQRNRTWSAEEKEVGLKAFGRGYAGWGFSQAFYREKLYESAYGAKDLEDFMVIFWEKWALSKDPENLLVMLHTWQAGDVSLQEPYHGDFERAMGAIKARTLVLPCKTDLYFPPEDSEYEVKNMSYGVGTLDVYPSIWGHWAGGPPGNMEDVKWLDERLAKIIDETPESKV